MNFHGWSTPTIGRKTGRPAQSESPEVSGNPVIVLCYFKLFDSTGLGQPGWTGPPEWSAAQYLRKVNVWLRRVPIPS